MIVSDSSSGQPFSWAPKLLPVLRRRRTILILPTLTGLAIGLFGYANTPLQYESEAVVALDVRRVQALPTETVISPLPQDSPVLRTELDIIGSRLMAEKVIARLERDGVTVHTEDVERTLLASAWETAAQWFEASAEPGIEPELGLEEETATDPDEERRQIDRLLSNLRVTNDGRSYTIFLSYRSFDPAFSARVANAYAEAYLAHQIEVQRSATRRVSDWLGETLISLRADLEASEQAAENFRQKAGLIRTDGATLQAQRVSALNAELIAARSALAGARARLATARELVDKGDVPSLVEVLNAETIQSLRTEKARLERRLGELRNSGAVKSSQMTMLASELDTLDGQISREIERVVESLSNEANIALNKQQSLEQALYQAQDALSKANNAEVTMGQLEREATANRTIYESYLVRYKQTIEQDGIAAPEAQIISPAEPANARASPRLAAWLLFGLGIGGTTAVAGAVFREAFDRRPYLPELIEAATDIPVIGAIPRLTRAEQRTAGADARHATSSLGRAVSLLRMSLAIAPGRKHSVALALVSTFEGDGRTTLALGMAHSAAAAGIRVVIVDANLRNPAVEQALSAKATAYIDEIVDSGLNATALVQRDPNSGLYFIAARVGSVAPELLFASEGFAALLAGLKSQFDLVLIDTPDLETSPDALQIASAADRVLFVTRFGAKGLQQVVAAARSLIFSGRRPEGIVLTQVDHRSYSELSERSFQSAMPFSTARATASDDAAGHSTNFSRQGRWDLS